MYESSQGETAMRMSADGYCESVACCLDAFGNLETHAANEAVLRFLFTRHM